MANANRPFGLAPVQQLGGSNWNEKGNEYHIASDYGSAVYVGDLVALTGESDAGGTPTIALCAAGATAVGVVMAVGSVKGGPWVDVNDLDKTWAPATKTKAYYALVIDDPEAIFEIQEIGTGTPLTAAAVGLNANIVYGAPATGVRYSGTTLDNTTEANTATLNLKIVRLARRVDNAIGQYAKYIVTINNHAHKAGVLGA